MPNIPRPTSGNRLDALEQDRQEAEAEAEAVARLQRDREKFARKAWWRKQTEIALGHANAINGGGAPPLPDYAADFLIQLRARLAEDGRLEWMDAIEKLKPTPLRLFVIGEIREAVPTARKAVAQRLKTELPDSKWWCKFWYEVNRVVSQVWDWFQDDVSPAGPAQSPTPPAVKNQRPCYARDHLWLKWADEGMGPAAIRDRWNEENPQDKIGEGESGRDSVKKGLINARSERETS